MRSTAKERLRTGRATFQVSTPTTFHGSMSDVLSRTRSRSSNTNGVSRAFLKRSAVTAQTSRPSAVRNARSHGATLVGFGEPGLRGRRFPAFHAGPFDVGSAKRNVPQRGLRVGLDLRLTVGAAAPSGDDESRTSFHDALELIVRGDARGVVVAETARALQQRRLDLVQLGHDRRREPL